MATRLLSVLILTSLMISANCFAADLLAENLMKSVDEIRNPSESFEMKVEVKSTDSSDVSVFDVSIQGNSKTLVKTMDPPRDRGRNLLMLDEEMWAYIPNLKRAVRVSLSQKLTGQAANGDISRMRWSGDYAGAIEKQGEKQDAKKVLVFMTAKKKGLTYEKIRAWIETGTNRPLQADFLTPAGMLLKRATYGGFKMMAGKIRPTEIRIQDGARPADVSVIKILSMNSKHFSDSLFNQNSLK